MHLIRAIGLTIVVATLSVPVRCQSSPVTHGVWVWSEDCGGNRKLSLELILNGRVIHRSVFPICQMNQRPDKREKAVVFYFKGGHVFQGEYRTARTETVEGNIWQAGADPDAILFGLTFTTDRILLNTIHIAKPHSVYTSKIDAGMVVRTFPLVRKKRPAQ